MRRPYLVFYLVRRKKVVVEEEKTEEAKKKKPKDKKGKQGKKLQVAKSEPIIENIEGLFKVEYIFTVFNKIFSITSIEVLKIVDEHSTITSPKEGDELAQNSVESPADTQVTDTDASTLPSPEYTDVEGEVEGAYVYKY